MTINVAARNANVKPTAYANWVLTMLLVIVFGQMKKVFWCRLECLNFGCVVLSLMFVVARDIRLIYFPILYFA